MEDMLPLGIHLEWVEQLMEEVVQQLAFAFDIFLVFSTPYIFLFLRK